MNKKATITVEVTVAEANLDDLIQELKDTADGFSEADEATAKVASSEDAPDEESPE